MPVAQPNSRAIAALAQAIIHDLALAVGDGAADAHTPPQTPRILGNQPDPNARNRQRSALANPHRHPHIQRTTPVGLAAPGNL